MTIDERIGMLRYEAAVAGDSAQVALCVAALAGDADVLAECRRVLDDADTQDDEQSVAERVADRFHNDGLCFVLDDGTQIEDVLENACTDKDQNWEREATRYDFADGSAIVIVDGAWDLAAENCADGFCWAGGGCTCVTEDEVGPEHAEGGYCATCEISATLRTCADCGAEQWILDCGHMDQPTPIAAGRASGHDLHNDYCEDCAAEDEVAS